MCRKRFGHALLALRARRAEGEDTLHVGRMSTPPAILGLLVDDEVLPRRSTCRRIAAGVPKGTVCEFFASGASARIVAVPRIAEFYGIRVEMYFEDHAPPHFHARYAGEMALVAIADGAVLRGHLPARAIRLVREWLELHRDELVHNWDRVQQPVQPMPIDPLP